MTDGFIRIHPRDNVGVALRDIDKGERVCAGEVEIILNEDVPRGHKIAIKKINSGGAAVKYGCPIGVFTQGIAPGDWVHAHNLKSALEYAGADVFNKRREFFFAHAESINSNAPKDFFMGYMRADGRAGIRNEIWIVPSVGCVNAVGKQIENKFRGKLPRGVDGITAYSHPYGCSQLGDDHETTKRALRGLIKHPNAGGVLVLGLGCENNALDELKIFLGDFDEERILFLRCQDFDDETAEAARLVERLVEKASADRRVRCDASLLVAGLKCGGSDGLSGITANPLTGRFTDRLIAAGGSAILTEVPEMFGAEDLLYERCANRAAYEKTIG